VAAGVHTDVLFKPVARELLELYLARGRPQSHELVFPDSQGGHLRRHNWRRRVWIPALERARVAYFRSYGLRHTCATLLLYEGRTLNEVAEHLGHGDPGFTARTYAHVMRDAARRRITISEAIRKGRRPAARRRPLVRPLRRRARDFCGRFRQEVPGNQQSRRADSNRGPLHYEGRTGEGRASTQRHKRARFRRKLNGSSAEAVDSRDRDCPS
jgi:hypothetical protein